MENTHHDLKSLFIEIPGESNSETHEKINCILILYSQQLSKLLNLQNISDYFSNLHIMSYDIKAIRNKHVNEETKLATFSRTRNMLIKDLYRLITLTEVHSPQSLSL